MQNNERIRNFSFQDSSSVLSEMLENDSTVARLKYIYVSMFQIFFVQKLGNFYNSDTMLYL